MRLIYLSALMAVFGICPAQASITPTMIVEMREMTSVSVSPNARLAVIGICHSNPRTNIRETSWNVVPLHGDAAPISVPGGAEIYDPGGSGTLLLQQALWSSDGKWFFYLRRDGEEVQLWETRADGRITRQLTHSASDLIALERSSDPDVFIVHLAPNRAALRKAEEDEYRGGILYDDHIIGGAPLTKTVPVIDRRRSMRWRSVKGSDTGEFAPLGWSEPTIAIFDVRRRELRINAANIPATFAATASDSGLGRVTVIATSPIPKIAYDYDGQYTLQLEPKAAGKPVQRCELAACTANRINVIGWSSDASEVYYLADSLQGHLGSAIPRGAAIYAWNPLANAVRLIHDSGAEGLWGRVYNLGGPAGLSFQSSPLSGREVVAAFAGVDQPPRLEAVNLDTGASRVLFDPNAELRSQTQGRAHWYSWETTTGYPGHGMMFLPDDYRPGQKYPAVITTYACGNGFLRGGSGDNAPEFVLAHEGFIAVCLHANVSEIIARETAAGRDLSRLYPIMCDLVSGLIADLTRSGKVDAARIGLTGQSLGASVGTYCISHSNAIAAAAFRHGSFPEPELRQLFQTAAWQRDPNSFSARLHLPDPHNDPDGRWSEISVAGRARDINTPTLIQVDDQEHLNVLPLWSAMHDAGKPIEMHVFPDDTHMLMRPIHMLVNFERQIDWFKFWLKQEVDPAPSKRGQYDRWERLRDLPRTSPPN